MLKVETENEEALEILLPRLINEVGISEAAKSVGIGSSLIHYWCMKLGIIVRTIALEPGQRVEVRGKAYIDRVSNPDLKSAYITDEAR